MAGRRKSAAAKARKSSVGKGRGRGRKAAEQVTVNGSSETEDTTKKDSTSVENEGVGDSEPKSIRLADKAELTRSDIRCPICWSTLIEPVTLPCDHSLCGSCFRKSIEETTLLCPCCRQRISSWARRSVKENKLLDEKLWKRIQAEFPILVEARLANVDTQNLMVEDEGMPVLSPLSLSPSLLEDSPRRPPALDGTICSEPGEVKQEYDELFKQHERDLQLVRLREETASADLIRQIQVEEEERRAKELEKEEEDFMMAKKLDEEFKSLAFSQSKSGSQDLKTPKRNLMKEWISSSGSVGRTGLPDVSELPQKKKLSSSQKIKGAKKTGGSGSAPKRRTSTNFSAPATVTRASQKLLTKFLSSSPSMLHDSQFLFDEDPMPSTSKDCFFKNSTVTSFSEPCTSSSIPKHDVRFSAFSPTKASNNFNILNPSKESLPIPVSISFGACKSFDEAFSSKTPDSIDSEIDRNFRPIKSAPKTPPRRRPDGTFLPEPRPLRMTPIKRMPSSTVSAYILSPNTKHASSSSSGLGLTSPPSTSSYSKPSCATAEKRISNDSGRASDNESGSPIDDSSSTKGSVTSAQFEATNDPGCSSDDYRVTPYDLPDPKCRKRSNEPEKAEAATKRFKVKTDDGDDVEQSLVPSWKEADEQDGNVTIELECSQGVITIDGNDDDFLQEEAREMARLKKKLEQEAADRAFALRLQKELNREEMQHDSRGKSSTNRYSIRNWLNLPEHAPRTTRGQTRKKN